MSTQARVNIAGPLVANAEARMRVGNANGTPASWWVFVTLHQPGDALPCVAELRIGDASPATAIEADKRAKALRRGQVVLVSAEGYHLHRAGDMPALALHGVSCIEAMPAQQQLHLAAQAA